MLRRLQTEMPVFQVLRVPIYLSFCRKKTSASGCGGGGMFTPIKTSLNTPLLNNSLRTLNKVHYLRQHYFVASFVTPHAQRERGKVIDRGVHIYIYRYIYVCGRKKYLNRTLEIDSPFQTFAVGLLVEFIELYHCALQKRSPR